jgi:hypothetical protein
MMSELFTRVAALEQRQTIVDSYLLASKPLDKAKVEGNVTQIQESTRKMCPHCGVKPNHFFHVKNCQEKNKNNGANPDQRRDSSKA